MTARSKVQPHMHRPDPEIPPDHRGRQRCTTCGLMGSQGDPHHPDAPPLPKPRSIPKHLLEAAAAREAAILGEKETQ